MVGHRVGEGALGAGLAVGGGPAVRIDLTGGWRLEVDSTAPQVKLAERELRSALGEPGEAGFEVALSHARGAGQGFRLHATEDRLEIRGESATATLFGVYAALEGLGAHWPWPDERRRAERAATLEPETVEGPALPGRGLVLGERALVEEAEGWISWAARNRLNSVFVHVSLEGNPAGAAPEASWLERRREAVATAGERGMTIEHGGHLLPELLPGEELRRLAAGRGLSGDARKVVERHVRAHPEAEVLHLWGADAPTGADEGEASDAALRSANSLAEVVEEVDPGTLVAFLAYHDTEQVPRRVRPRDNVCLVFAPRERCYDHALADPECRQNARHRELLEAQLEHFEGAPARVFEYWFDAILFSGGVPDLTETMARDLALYGNAGVHTVHMLATGHGRPPSPHPNPVAFTRLAWDPAANPIA